MGILDLLEALEGWGLIVTDQDELEDRLESLGVDYGQELITAN